MFVTDIIPEKNQVVLGEEEDIFKTELIAKDINLIPFDSFEGEMEVTAKVDILPKPAAATIIQLDKDRVRVKLKKTKPITKGQSVFFMIKTLLLAWNYRTNIINSKVFF